MIDSLVSFEVVSEFLAVHRSQQLAHYFTANSMRQTRAIPNTFLVWSNTIMVQIGIVIAVGYTMLVYASVDLICHDYAASFGWRFRKPFLWPPNFIAPMSVVRFFSLCRNYRSILSDGLLSPYIAYNFKYYTRDFNSMTNKYEQNVFFTFVGQSITKTIQVRRRT